MLRVLIAVIGSTGNEPEALRQVLESFGCLVLTKYIGRPADLVAILSGSVPYDPEIVILSCHGEKGEIIMPPLGEAVYTEDEPKGNFGASEIKRHLQLKGKTIINLGCTTGLPDLASIFAAENIYIAPTDYVEGSSALLFVINFFYQMLHNKLIAEAAWKQTYILDSETSQFTFYKNPD